MQSSSPFSGYKKNIVLKDENSGSPNEIKFHVDDNWEESNKQYLSKGWLGRKVIALPLAIWSGVVKTTYHLVKAILIGIPKAFSDKGRYLKLEFFHIGRDFQAAYGRLASLVNDKYGQYHIQESIRHKNIYDSFTKEKTWDLIKQNDDEDSSSRSEGSDEGLIFLSANSLSEEEEIVSLGGR